MFQIGELPLKSLLVVYSYHHLNTEKIAKVFAKVLDAEIKAPQQIDPEKLEEYDMIGFGAGIDSGKHYQPLLDLADNLSEVTNKKAFIFSTAALTGEKKSPKTTQRLGRNCKIKVIKLLVNFNAKASTQIVS